MNNSDRLRKIYSDEDRYVTYWLLDVAVHRRVPIATLLPDDPSDSDYFSVVFNRRSHGLNLSEVHKRLVDLFTSGLILAWYLDDDEDVFARPRHGGIIPSQKVLEDELRNTEEHESRLHYGLSQQGGSYWEELAQPKWDRYIEKIESASRHICLSSHTLKPINEILTRDTEEYRIVEPSSVYRERIHPWYATYWKHFRAGHRVCYSLWPENDLTKRGASINSYSELDSLSARSMPRWRSDI